MLGLLLVLRVFPWIPWFSSSTKSKSISQNSTWKKSQNWEPCGSNVLWRTVSSQLKITLADKGLCALSYQYMYFTCLSGWSSISLPINGLQPIVLFLTSLVTFTASFLSGCLWYLIQSCSEYICLIPNKGTRWHRNTHWCFSWWCCYLQRQTGGQQNSMVSAWISSCIAWLILSFQGKL